MTMKAVTTVTIIHDADQDLKDLLWPLVTSGASVEIKRENIEPHIPAGRGPKVLPQIPPQIPPAVLRQGDPDWREPAKKQKSVRPAHVIVNGVRAVSSKSYREGTDDPRTVYEIVQSGKTPYQRINVEATLARIGMTEEQIYAGKWKQGTLEAMLRKVLGHRRSQGSLRPEPVVLSSDSGRPRATSVPLARNDDEQEDDVQQQRELAHAIANGGH
jgi:hypothetical protein